MSEPRTAPALTWVMVVGPEMRREAFLLSPAGKVPSEGSVTVHV